MSYGESAAVFSQRALEIGLTDANLKCLTDENITTMSRLAFCCNYTPGQDEKPFIDLVKKLLKRDPNTLETSCFRRLFAESYANVASDIKARTEATDEAPVRRLPPAERASRLKDQQTRLAGMRISGQYEPGNTLIDKCINIIYDSDRLQYVDWSSSVSREHELLTGTKKDSMVTFDVSGVLKLSKQKKSDPCEAASEIQVRYCLVRRALAFDQANLIEFKFMDVWTEKLLQSRLEDPPQGFARTSMKQLEQADRKLFCVLAEKTRDGIKSTTAGRPLDKVFKECIECSEVMSLLQPKPMQHSEKSKDTGGHTFEPGAKRQKRDHGNKGKGKGNKGSNGAVRMPRDLLKLNCVAATPKNQRICFSYKL